MANRKRLRDHVSRFVAIEHRLMRTEAWRSLSCVARCVYIEIKSRYAGSDNGFIPFSLLEMARVLSVSKATVMRALTDLQERGFLVPTVRGGFNVKIRDKGVRRATEWRLTEYRCDRTNALPTREFDHWRASEKQNAVSCRNPMGTVVKPSRLKPES